MFDATLLDQHGILNRLERLEEAVYGATSADVEKFFAIFERWKKYHSRMKRYNSQSKEWTLIASRLREGWKLEDLLLAVDGIHKSPFHNGQNPEGKKYISLQICFRTSAHVERFVWHAKGGGKKMSKTDLDLLKQQEDLGLINETGEEENGEGASMVCRDNEYSMVLLR